MYIDDIYVVDMHILYYTVICLMRVQENARLPTMEKDIYSSYRPRPGLRNLFFYPQTILSGGTTTLPRG